MTHLRIALPPLASLSPESPVQFAWLDRQGQVSREGQSSLAQLGQTSKAALAECFLHPQDSLLASIDLPPLPAARARAAVSCAAQALILGDSESMHVAHGPRDAHGQVPISWLPKAALERLGQVLGEAHLRLRGVYPAPYALPVPAQGELTACRMDEHLLVRRSVQSGEVLPLVDEALHELQASGAALCWVGEAPPASATNRLPAARRWTGVAPGWGLHGGARNTPRSQQGWGRALACCGVAVAVWTLGLNLYAAREAAQGQQLKTQMNQRVKQAFPELPVILNPLQQARQQLAARQSGAATDPSLRFVSLVQQAGVAMPFMAGGVQSLVFEQGELHLSLLAETRQSTADTGWQAALTQAGLEARRDDGGWTLRLLGEPPASAADSPAGTDDE